MVCVPYKFRKMSEQEAFWEAMSVRQTATAVHDAVKRNAIQQVFEVTQFKQAREAIDGEPLQVAELQKLFQDNAHLAKSAALSDTHVANALSVHDKILQHPQCYRIVENLDRKFGLASCLTLPKLKVICEKCDTLAEIQWFLESLEYQLLETKTLSNESIGTYELRGNAQKISLIELAKLRMKVSQHLLDVEFPKTFHLPDLSLIREHVLTHSDFKKNCMGQESLRWQSKLLSSSMLVLKVLEDIMFEVS